MSRRLIIFGVCGLAGAATVLAAVGFLGLDRSSSDEAAPRAPADAHTPGEILAAVTVRPDGRLDVEETIVFDALDGSGRPVVRRLEDVPLGFHSELEDDDKAYYRLYAAPTYSAPAEAVELVREGDPIPLDVEIVTEDSDEDDGDSGSDSEDSDTEWRFTRRDGDWPAGRHAIRVTYTVERAHVTFQGSGALVVPLPRGDLAGSAIDLVTLTVRGEGIADGSCKPERNAYRDSGEYCGRPTDEGFTFRHTFNESAM
ncbi:MAG TPA: DUF2207 domain-containing protein, partial [Actinopolymorphaceae bacterium]